MAWTSLVRFCQHIHFNVTDFKLFGRNIRTNETIAWHHLPRTLLWNLLMGNWKMIIQTKNAAQLSPDRESCFALKIIRTSKKINENLHRTIPYKEQPYYQHWVPRFPGYEVLHSWCCFSRKCTINVGNKKMSDWYHQSCKNCQWCQSIGANFSRPVLIFLQSTRKTDPLWPLVISLIS